MDNLDRKDVDLAPYEWQSEREKPREPIFGFNAKPFIVMFIVGLVVSTAYYQLTYWWLPQAIKQFNCTYIFGTC